MFLSEQPIEQQAEFHAKIGIKRAEQNANDKHKNWSGLAYLFLLAYINDGHNEFMAEQVRNASRGIVPEPPSNLNDK